MVIPVLGTREAGACGLGLQGSAEIDFYTLGPTADCVPAGLLHVHLLFVVEVKHGRGC